MEVSAHTATSEDGTPIAWYDFGGNGPDLLLAHATGFCGRIWEPVVSELLTHFRCVSYDVRGHGDSGRPDYGRSGWNWERYGDDAIAVLAAARLEAPFGLGHSCGGATEILVEQRLPGTFRSLYLFEPVLFRDDPPLGPMPERDLAVRTRRRRASFDSRDEAIANFAGRGPFTTLDPAALAAYVDHGFRHGSNGSIELKCHPDDEAEVYVMATAHEGFLRLGQIGCPVTIGHGELSHSFSSDDMKAVVERLRTGRFAGFPGRGHFGPLEQPVEFAQAVVAGLLGQP